MQLNLDLSQLNDALAKTATITGNNTITGAVATAMLRQTQTRFRTQTGPGGQKWQPSGRVKRATQKFIGGNAQTLSDSGHLRNSFTTATNNNRAIVGTNIIYAAIHQFGGPFTIPAHTRHSAFGRPTKPYTFPATQKNMPARPFLGFAPENITEITQIILVIMQKTIGGGQ